MRSLSSNKRGFALLITVTLLAFLVLLLVSMASLTRVETQVAANSQSLARARQNALLALNLAIGQLQRFAGPDQRATARADLTKPSAANPYWTGVWGNGEATTAPHGSPVLLNWLVSGNEDVTFTADTAAATFGKISAPPASISSTPDAALSAADSVTLVGSTTAGATPANYVTAPLKEIKVSAGQLPGFASTDTTATTVGHYAWWVGDEGVKARLNVTDPWAPRVATTTGSPAVGAFTPTADQARLRQASAQRLGIERITGLSAYNVSDPTSAAVANFRRDLAKVAKPSQAAFAGLDATVLRARFHDISTISAGVPADAYAGGLKKDLTAAFAPGTTVTTAPTGALWTQGALTGPAWQLLRSYYQIPDAAGSSGNGTTSRVAPRAQTDAGVHGIYPLVAFYQIYIEGRLIANGGGSYSLQMRHYPVVVLWNPYNATLTNTIYHAEFSFNGIAGVFFTRIASTAGGPAIDANAQAGSPYFYSREGLTNSSGAVRTTAQSALQFTIESGDLPPGQAFVYSLPGDVAFTTVANYDNYRLTRGWHAAGLNAITANSPGSFMLPALPAGQNYTFRTWVGGGGDGGNVIANQNLPLWNEATPATGSGTVPAISGSDSFVLRMTNASGAVIQSVLRNNTYLRTAATDSTLSGNLPANPGSMSLGYFAQKAALKVTDGGSIPDTSASNVINSPIRWLANYNPRATYSTRSAYENQGSGGHGYFNSNPSFNTVTTTVGGKYGRPFASASSGFPVNFSGSSTEPRAFVGMTQSNWPITDNDPQVTLFDLPRADTRIASLGALQHVNAYRAVSTEALASNSSPAYPIANSLADPRVGLGAVTFSTSGFATSAVTGTVADHSYLLNRALWDGYFFSTVPTAAVAASVAFPLPNARYEAVFKNNAAPSDANLRDYSQAAANLLVSGAFNVNSTSVEAWRAVLGGVNNVPVGATTRTGEAPYPRTLYPPDDTAVLSATTTHAGNDVLAYRGYRFLAAAQIDSLATQMVIQVRARGPFVSLADFVNRALTDNAATAADERLMGALAAAIEAAGINSGFTGDKTGAVPNNTGYTDMPAASAHDGPTATNVPGYVTQADLLQPLGPALTVRSDTFVIRTYGDVVNPVTLAVEGRAWCEATVQRMPDYVDTTDSSLAALGAATAPKNTQLTNQTFGRRFVTTSFRWLSPSDI